MTITAIKTIQKVALLLYLQGFQNSKIELFYIISKGSFVESFVKLKKNLYIYIYIYIYIYCKYFIITNFKKPQSRTENLEQDREICSKIPQCEKCLIPTFAILIFDWYCQTLTS